MMVAMSAITSRKRSSETASSIFQSSVGLSLVPRRLKMSRSLLGYYSYILADGGGLKALKVLRPCDFVRISAQGHSFDAP